MKTTHPTIERAKAGEIPSYQQPTVLDDEWLRELCLEAGAHDVGFVEIERPSLAEERNEIEKHMPWAKSLIGYVVRMNREPIRSTARGTSNLEFHHSGDLVNDVGRNIVAALEWKGVRAINPAMGFPMEAQEFPGRLWTVAHKPVAEAAGLGKMGIHRNVIHPRFGNFILLGTIVVDTPIAAYDQPVDYNPCLECKLCVAACPVGAIGTDGSFNFNSCFTHNYREFMGGFSDWVENIADSKDRAEYRSRVSNSETVSMWQSLSYGSNYKAAYCMSVCPAGEDVIGPFLKSRKTFLEEVVKPLQNKEEIVYVVSGSDAIDHVKKRFPHKHLKVVKNGIRPRSIENFRFGMRLLFQPGQAGELNAVYHFTFTGNETAKCTVTIRRGELTIEDGHQGKADLRVTADSETWLRFLAEETSIVWALITRKVKLKGPVTLLKAFGRCFPS